MSTVLLRPELLPHLDESSGSSWLLLVQLITILLPLSVMLIVIYCRSLMSIIAYHMTIP